MLPIGVAAAITYVSAQEVFPTDAGAGGLLILLGWAGAGTAFVARMTTRPRVIISAGDDALSLIDRETGVGNARQLEELLHREIARSLRYGDRSALAVFEIGVVGFQPSPGQERPPSPARFVAQTLVNAVRDSDPVLRLDRSRFVAILAECDDDGARRLIERVRTQLSTTPYARNADGSGIYTRAWGAAAPWNRAYTTPDGYVQAALAALAHSRGGYEAAQAWFTGELGALPRSGLKANR
ncbi:MAG: GGDEF domain-containing protein [Hyphomicrobiales bacterium]